MGSRGHTTGAKIISVMFMKIFQFIFTITILSLLIAGCSPREVVREDEEDIFADELRDYEREFDPSKYNAPFVIQIEEDEEEETRIEPERIPETEEPETPEYIQGFRIQLYSTSDMEAAQDVHDFADSLFTDQWVYVVYEVPFYKVRLGDFETRPQANRILAHVIDAGFRDSWIVPDRVLQDPPEKIIEDEDDNEVTDENGEDRLDELQRSDPEIDWN